MLPFGEQKQQLEKWQEDRLNDRSFDRKDIKEGDKVKSTTTKKTFYLFITLGDDEVTPIMQCWNESRGA